MRVLDLKTIVRPRYPKLGASTLRLSSELATRRIDFRAAGRSHGPITRLMSPSDIGEMLKPFVFLDHAEFPYTGPGLSGAHPHSGVATLTTVLQGRLAYADSTGNNGEIQSGGLEWIKAGRGVWHDGGVLAGDPLRVFQLWIALSPGDESAAPECQYISPQYVQEEGPVRVILGRYGRARSPIHLSDDIDFFHVKLNAGDRWHYTPRLGFNVAWLAVDKGLLFASEFMQTGQLAVFEQSEETIAFRADCATSFVFGSAIKHPHALVLGDHSVHTSRDALVRGEAEIVRLGKRLREEGLISTSAITAVQEQTGPFR